MSEVKEVKKVKPEGETVKYKATTLYIPEDMALDFHAHCIRNKTSMSALGTKIIGDFLKLKLTAK